jgi:hypothetical protein
MGFEKRPKEERGGIYGKKDNAMKNGKNCV